MRDAMDKRLYILNRSASSEGLSYLKTILLIPLLLLLTTCAVNPVTGRHELMLVSESEEIAIGREAAPSLKWSYGGEYRDERLRAYLEGIVRRIWKHSERPYLPMTFVIQNTTLPNAFALPGYVAITRGLLAELDNEAQFVAVMGHEVGHVMARHTARRITLGTLQQLGLIIGGIALGGKSGGNTLLQVGAIGSSLLMLKFDRSQELEADRLGVKYMAMLGYDPYEAIKAHDRLEVAINKYLRNLGKRRQEDNFLTTILSTHPREEVRKEEMLQMIKRLPPYKVRGDGRFRKRFQRAIRRLRQINRVYYVYDRAVLNFNKDRIERAEALLKKAIEKANREAPFYNLYGMIEYKKGEYKSAERYFRKALSLYPDYQPAFYGLGILSLKEKEYYEAVNRFKKSLGLFPDHAPSHFGLGKSYFYLGRYSSAIPHLRAFASAAPGHPEVHGLLGICYENTGNIRAAIREYSLQVRIAPHSDLGRYARQRLFVLRGLYRR